MFGENKFSHSPEKRVEDYKFFTNKKERQELFQYSQKIAEYLRTEKVPNLVIIDRSSRPLYIGVREYLRAKYPEEEMPNTYFMNPKGFKAKEDLSDEEIEEIIQDCEYKGDASEEVDKIRSREQILHEFEESYQHLMADKDKPVMIFDTCIHSGNSLGPVKDVFDQKGFADVRVGSVNPSESTKVESDFYITERRPEKGCYPFDRDRLIEKTFDHVYSARSTDPNKRQKSIELRREIKNIMGNFLEKAK